VPVVITCGHSFSGYHQVHQLLETAGVSAAHPSRRDSMCAQELHDGISRVLGWAALGADVCAPLSPGKLWQDLAADLFLANLGNETWGWADSRSTWLLDFWSQFETQIRFVLVYASPERGVAEMLVNGGYSLETLPTLVSDWIRWNAELLRYSVHHPERCFLVNSGAIERPEQLVDSINATLGLNLVCASDRPRNNAGSADTIATTLVSGLIEEFHEAMTLYRQLESAANFEEHSEVPSMSQKLRVWNDYMARLSRERRAEERLVEQSSLLKVLDHERKNYEDSSARTRLELQVEAAKLQEVVAADVSIQEEIAQLRDKSGALTRENELLFLQLNQVQEALDQTAAREAASELERDRTKTRMRELSTTATDGVTGELAEVMVDLRRGIEGKNWYSAESDGRWAGPETLSTIRVPAMGQGRYKLEIEVVDAMDPTIVHGMEVSLCGERVTLSRSGRSYPMIISGDAAVRSLPGSRAWEVQFRFSGLVSPAAHGSDDKRLLAVRIRSIRLRLLDENSNISGPRR
jgi:hypothetical protein